MLIIFDLDDTLIDTSGCITHFKLEDALNAMQAAGLKIADFKTSLQLLRRLNRTAESAKAALSEFLEITESGNKFFDVGVKEIYDTSVSHLPIFSVEGAWETLQDLGQHHQLALVTMGDSAQQMEKLKKAGIDSGIFSKIVVSKDANKKSHYQIIVDELGYSPKEVLVCGDRILVDLLPARELGFKTVHMQWGRGLNPTLQREEVDYKISEIGMLKNIVNDLLLYYLGNL